MSVLKILGASAPHAPAEGALELLLGCHARIRSFTELAARVASADKATDAEVADAARRVHRYHTVALPLHQADEEQSLAPRLEKVAPARVLDAVEAMKREHVLLDQVLADLIPLWFQLTTEPGRRAELSAAMGRGVARMQDLWAVHLGGEEDVIFPALRAALPPVELARMSDELRARRAPSVR